MKSDDPPSRHVGRPRSFDRDLALRQAMLAFWRSGYETTSVSDLTAAMSITAPSLYAAFGDKQRLFLEAMRLYAGDEDETARAISGAPSARAAAAALLDGAAIIFTGEDTPPGCLLASAAASGSAASLPVRGAVTAVRACLRDRLRRRIEQDRDTGALPDDTDAAALADFTVAAIQGLSVLARDGLERREVQAVAAQALWAWPRAPTEPICAPPG